MINDILQNIINYSKLKIQLVCMQTNKHIYHNTYISKIYRDREVEYDPPLISQRTIKQKKYSKLKYLDCRRNYKIFDLEHLTDSL